MLKIVSIENIYPKINLLKTYINIVNGVDVDFIERMFLKILYTSKKGFYVVKLFVYTTVWFLLIFFVYFKAPSIGFGKEMDWNEIALTMSMGLSASPSVVQPHLKVLVLFFVRQDCFIP